MQTTQSSVKYLPDHGQQPVWSYRASLWYMKIRLFFSEFFIIYDQDKFDYELTYWEKRSDLAHYLGERRRKVERGEHLKVDALAHVGNVLFHTFISSVVHWFLLPLFTLLGANNWFALPVLRTGEIEPTIQNVEKTNKQRKAQVEGTPYGMEEAAMLCQCDGHRLFLYSNTPVKILLFCLTGTALLFGPMIVLVDRYSFMIELATILTVVGLVVLSHFPVRHGVIFDRDAQTAMLIRGWFRKPLVVPFEGIFFTSYTEDVRNFSKDLIVFSQYVPHGRKKPIRLVLNTAVGSTGYSMAQVVGAVDCFMDKNNTQAMPLSIKHSIEWHRKHKLTLWHMAWRPLPEEELPKYTAADSLYQTDLLDPKDKAFKFQLTAEGREVMRKEDILNRYLAAVWEHMSLEGIDADLKKAAESEFGTEALEKRIREQAFDERHQCLDLVLEVCEDFESRTGKLKDFSDELFVLGMNESKESLSYIFSALKGIHKSKPTLLAQSSITYEQYKNSFKYSKPLPESELARKKLVAFTAAKETD